MIKEARSQRVLVENRYARAEYPSLESAARALSSIGVLKESEVRKMLDDREPYINGFSVKYL